MGSSGPLLPTPGHTACQGRTLQRLGHQRSQKCPWCSARRVRPGPTTPGGSGPPGAGGHNLCPHLRPGTCNSSPAPRLLPSSNAGPWGQGLRSPICTRISMVGTYMCPTWTMHAACVYLRSNACCVYTPATCTGHGVYTMDSAHKFHTCARVCLPRHKHGAYHTEMHMHVALHTAILSVGTVAHA